jgi:hypothetical protein
LAHKRALADQLRRDPARLSALTAAAQANMPSRQGKRPAARQNRQGAILALATAAGLLTTWLLWPRNRK